MVDGLLGVEHYGRVAEDVNFLGAYLARSEALHAYQGLEVYAYAVFSGKFQIGGLGR